MKIIFRIVLLTLAFAATSCSSKITMSNIVGEWEVQRFTQTEKQGTALLRCPDDWNSGSFSLKNDNTALLILNNTRYHSTYELKNGVIVFHEAESGLTLPYSIRHVGNNELIIDHFHKDGIYEVSRTFVLVK